MTVLTSPQPIDAGRVRSLMAALRGCYPFLDIIPVGNSVRGREIMAFVIGRGREKVLMAAGFHAQEWMTSWVTLRLCEEICRALSANAQLYGWSMRRAMIGRSIICVPMVNPDGTQIALHGSAAAGENSSWVREKGGDICGCWQANIRGVDLNHNYPAGWQTLHACEQAQGITAPGPRRVGGNKPGSEPETAAMMQLCRRVRFRHAVALHSQGEEIYWSYGQQTPPQSRLMALLMSAVSGYQLSEPETIATGGGFKDWFIEQCGRPGFTVELGKGINPLPVSVFEETYAKAAEMLLLSLMM